MPEQFVNPVPTQRITKYLSFDFPCDPVAGGIGVEPPPGGQGSGSYVAFTNNPKAYGNVNLNTPGIEQLYGPLGNPPRQQGHPFVRENPPEPGDPPPFPVGNVTHDQIVDIDHGFIIDHTARLSGSFVEFLASEPFYSVITVRVHDLTAGGFFALGSSPFRNWLTPSPEEINVWYWRFPDVQRELLQTRQIEIDDPAAAGFKEEHLYKLVFRWAFYKYTGPLPYPALPPLPAGGDARRLEISGFDESMNFQVVRATFGP